MKKSLKLIFLTREPYPTNRSLLSELWNKNFKDRGHEIVWVMQPVEANSKIRNLNWNGSKVYLTRNINRTNIFTKFLSSVLRIYDKFKITNDLMLKHNFDIIQVRNGIPEGFLARYFRNKYKVFNSFHLSSMHGFYDSEILSKEFKGFNLKIKQIMRFFSVFLYKNLIRNVDSFQPITKWMQKSIETFSLSPSNVLPLPLSGSSLFLSNSEIYDKNLDTIVYLGTIRASRDINFLFEIFREVKLSFPTAKLLIVGDDELRDHKLSLKIYKKSLNLDDNIDITGFVDYQRVPEFLSRGFLGISFIKPTRKFLVSAPSKLVDYMSLGMPVVANSEIYFQKDILKKSKGGILVRYRKKEFIKAILWFFKNPVKAKCLGKNGRNWINKYHNYELLSKRLETHYFESKKETVI